MPLKKATVAVLDDHNIPRDELDVQFNPTSLKLQVTNTIEGGKTLGKQVRQYIGSSSTTLTLDLIFDTADEGTTENPRSVREKTAMVERFLRPKADNKRLIAPRVRFHWDQLVFDGVVDSLTIDLDHFAANGAPLRAKVLLAIKEQNRDLEVQPSGKTATGVLGGSIGVGLSAGIGLSASVGLGASASIGVALEGESSAEFAARVGVDPAAWRGLQIGGESSISLSAGVEVGFDASLSASAGLGVTLGVEAGASASLEASFGLEANASTNAVAGVGVELASGIALSSAGGVAAALASVQSVKNQAAEQQARAAFQAPAKALPAASAPTGQATIPASTAAGAIAARPKPPEQPRTPLNATGLPSLSAQQAAPAAPRRPHADARASSFGFGVPLRTTVGQAADLRAGSMQGDVVVKPRIASGEPPATSNPTTPAWVALPARDRGRNASDRVQSRLRPTRPCGCAGRCKH